MCKVSPVVKQFLLIACCNILTFTFGISSGWATINLLELENENTTYSTGTLTQDETSLVVSISNLGGLAGNFVVLPLSQIIGTKRTIHFLCLPLMISTILTIWAKNVYYLYVSRVLTGLAGGGLAVGIPTLINEISHDNVRGALNSLYDPFNNTGLIVSFFIGNYLSIVNQAKMQLIPPIICLCVMFFLPDSPEFWSTRNKEKRAIKSHRFYKGSIAAPIQPDKTDYHPVPVHGKDEAIENGVEKSHVHDDELNSPLTFKDFCTPHAKKALFISLTTMLLSFLSGTLSIVSFITHIFKETGSSLSEKDSSILVSITQLTANLTLLNVIERFNRRTLYIWSSFLSTASYFLFAAYGYLWLKQPGFEWMPPFCFACVVYFSCMGLLPMPYIITIEIFPKKIRKACLAMAVSLLWIILFLLGARFLRLTEILGLFNCMIVLGFICLLNALFGIFFVPETRGKSYEEIKNIMNR